MADERDPGFVARNYLTVAIVLILLIWDPLNHLLPAWLVIRVGCLIAIPIAARLLLNWIWKACKPGKAAEERFERALYALTAGFFLGLAYHDGSAKSHVYTEELRTRDELIEIGDPIVRPGPNKRNVALGLLFAGLAFWFSVRGEEKEERRYY